MTDVDPRFGVVVPELSDTADVSVIATALLDILAMLLSIDGGDYASRPAAGVFGRMYRQTDSGGGSGANTITFDNGATWEAIAPVDAAAAVASMRTLGTAATSAAAGNDVRLLAGEKGFKAPVRAVHTTNLTTTNPGTMTFGGVVCSEGDRILLTGQSTGAQNGLWVVGASSSAALTRPTDFATDSIVAGGCVVPVSESSTTRYVDSLWMVTTNDTSLVVGTDTQAWSQVGGADVALLNGSNSWGGSNDFDGNVIIDGGLIIATQSSNSGTTSISSAAGFRHDYTGTGGHTLTLPQQSSGLWHGMIVNRGTGSVTVARASTDTYTVDGTAAQTSFVLEPGEIAFVFQSPGVGDVFRIGNRAAADETVAGDKTVTGRTTFSRAPIHAVQAFTASGNILATGGKNVTFIGASGQTLTLPALVEGMEFTIYNLDTTDNLTVACGGGDFFRDGATTSLIVTPGGKVTVRALSTRWYQEWPLGQLVAGGFTSSTGALAGAGDKLSLGVTGDGSTAMRVFTKGYMGSSPGGAGAAVYWQVRTGAAGGGTFICGAQLYGGGVSGVPDNSFEASDSMDPFTGARTLYGNIQNASGTPTIYGNQPYAGRSLIRVEWAPGDETIGL